MRSSDCPSSLCANNEHLWSRGEEFASFFTGPLTRQPLFGQGLGYPARTNGSLKRSLETNDGVEHTQTAPDGEFLDTIHNVTPSLFKKMPQGSSHTWVTHAGDPTRSLFAPVVAHPEFAPIRLEHGDECPRAQTANRFGYDDERVSDMEEHALDSTTVEGSVTGWELLSDPSHEPDVRSHRPFRGGPQEDGARVDPNGSQPGRVEQGQVVTSAAAEIKDRAQGTAQGVRSHHVVLDSRLGLSGSVEIAQDSIGITGSIDG
jgi:hypothetical protein